MAAVGGDDADALTAVVGAAAAQRDDQVAAVGFVHFITFVHIFIGGIGLGAVIDHRHHIALGPDNPGNPISDAGVGDALVRTDKRFGAAEHFDLVADLLVCAHTHQGNGGDEKSKYLFLYCHGVLLWRDVNWVVLPVSSYGN